MYAVFVRVTNGSAHIYAATPGSGPYDPYSVVTAHDAFS